MPYLAMNPDGDRVLPLDVGVNDHVLCPLCECNLRVRSSHYNRGNFVAEHFFHPAGSMCPGESTVQAKMKTVAAMKLREIFPAASVAHEEPIPKIEHTADVLATFERPVFPYGNGIAVEFRPTNDDKQVDAISSEVLRAGYTVYWAYQEDFDGHDMSFREDQLRTPWPHAIPITEDIDGYSEVVQQLLKPDSPDAVEISVPFPDEYLRAHALEVVPPLRGYYDSGTSPDGWQKISSLSLHGKGTERAWVNVIQAPSDHVFLEFWKKDMDKGNSSYLICHIGEELPDRFEQFMDSAQTWFKRGYSNENSDLWVSGPSISFCGTSLCESWLSLAKTPRGPVRIIIGRKDLKGNTRTWSVPYRKGDLSRLAALRHPVKQVFSETG